MTRVYLPVVALGLLVPGSGAQTTTRVSVDSAGIEANAWSNWLAVSGDGNLVVFNSYATNLVTGDTNGFPDLFLHDRTTGATRRMSLGVGGVQPNNWVGTTSISADGRFVAVDTLADNFIPGDTNGFQDIFIVDVQSGSIVLATVSSSGAQGDGASGDSSLSADGRFLAFVSYAQNLIPNDTNYAWDVFVRDLVGGTTERISVGNFGKEAAGDSRVGSISADGRYVAFHSLASNLAYDDVNGGWDIFVRDRLLGTTVCASVDPNGIPGNASSSLPSLSSDGRFVAFDSAASNLIPGDGNGVRDIFVRDLANGTTVRVSVDSSGTPGNGDSADHVAISGDGSAVAFLSWASNLVAGDINGQPDMFMHSLATGITRRVGVASDGAEANGPARRCAISADGSAVVFSSAATNLVLGDSNSADDIFVHEPCAATASWTNYGNGFPGTHGIPSFTPRNDPVLGQGITLDLGNSAGSFTVGLLFLGFQRTQIHSGWGGDLLLIPVITTLIALPPAGTTFTGTLPDDEALCGLELDLQAIESDGGAAKGVSFTPGLALTLGR